MRVVLDTNILVSALLVQMGHPAAIYRAWQEGYFTLLTCAEHLDELRATLRKPAIAERIKPIQKRHTGQVFRIWQLRLPPREAGRPTPPWQCVRQRILRYHRQECPVDHRATGVPVPQRARQATLENR